MKTIFVVSMVILLVAGPVLAVEKLPDKVNASVADVRIVLAGTLDGSSPIWNRIYNNSGAVDLGCQLPSTDSSLDGQYYDLFCIESNGNGPIEIAVDDAQTQLGDTVMALYCDPFDPLTPMVNLIAYDDDDGQGLYSAFTAGDNILLTPGIDYWLVLSTFSPGDSGGFVINTSANVLECGTVDRGEESWGRIKSIYR